MSYLVLARKYRPETFSSVTGQEHVTRTLANAIKRDKVAHAYLFCGPRGIGKTSIARIFSKALNCEKGPTPTPCLECTNCQEILAGNSLAVREIDGASHNSVENVRELIESFRSLPPSGSRYKIYIIDEVHMLSSSAFNALLKSLEEPPPNTVFILATTEPHKIPETVISRCQRHDFRALTREQIEACLKEVAAQEKMEIEPLVLRLIARLSDGSMRDAQSLLDRVQSFCAEDISVSETVKILGAVDYSTLFSLSNAVFSKDASKVLEVINEAFRTGVDPALFLKEFVAHWRDLLVAKFGGKKALKDVGIEAEADDLLNHVAKVDGPDLQDLVQLAREGSDSALRSSYPKYALEALLVRMATREPVRDIAKIVGHLKGLMAGGQKNPRTPAPKKKTEKKTPAVIVPKERPKVETTALSGSTKESSGGGNLDWFDFVQFVSDLGEKMLSEQLKRLAVVEFVPGTLRLKGPEFSVKYFNESEQRKKVCDLVEQFSGSSKWRLEMEVGNGEGASEANSIHAVQTEENRAKRKQKEVDIKNHPKVQSIKKAFPGAEIEEVK